MREIVMNKNYTRRHTMIKLGMDMHTYGNRCVWTFRKGVLNHQMAYKKTMYL